MSALRHYCVASQANTGQQALLLDGERLHVHAAAVANAGCGGIALSGGDYASLSHSHNRVAFTQVCQHGWVCD